MELTIIAIVALGVLIFAAFLVVWLADARRAEKVDHDPERLNTGPDEGPHEAPADAPAGAPPVTESAEMPQELPGWRRPPL
jgi:hypothetical protein